MGSKSTRTQLRGLRSLVINRILSPRPLEVVSNENSSKGAINQSVYSFSTGLAKDDPAPHLCGRSAIRAQGEELQRAVLSQCLEDFRLGSGYTEPAGVVWGIGKDQTSTN